jgi:hypothetical protein
MKFTVQVNSFFKLENADIKIRRKNEEMIAVR